MKRLKCTKGFTLVEILVVLIILAILAAVAIPSMIGYIKNTDEKICISHRGTLSRLYQAVYVEHHLDTDPVSIQKFLESKYVEIEEDLKSINCPAGGVFSEKDKKISCSIHGGIGGGESGGGEPGGGEEPGKDVIPGTDIPIGNNGWPVGEDEFSGDDPSNLFYKFTAGDIFGYESKNYVIVQDWSISTYEWGNNNRKPNTVVNNGYLLEVKNKIWNKNDVTSGDRIEGVAQGEMYKADDGKYYIYRHNGGWGGIPPNSDEWFEMPTGK